ncbi:MAG TPA: NUDIX domain-containing protein [Chitinophagales bacterium]|nr:NUDIX domain-containing protein [Chitinophagales bacterium]
MTLQRFSVRVYGLLTNEKQQILVSHEHFDGIELVKFAGGGVELGEGIVAALHREFREECDITIAIQEHLYTTENLIISTFKPHVQVICVYYWVTTTDPINHQLLPNIYTVWQDIAQISDNYFSYEGEQLAFCALKKRLLL